MVIYCVLPQKKIMNTNNQQQTNYNPEEISLKDIVFFLWNQKTLIIVFTLLFSIASIVFALISPEKYKSTSKLITKTSSSTPAGNLAQMAALAGVTIGRQNKSDPSEYLSVIINDKEFIEKILVKKWYIKGDSIYLTDIWEMEPDTTIENWQFVFEKEKMNKLREGKFINLSKDRKTGLLTLSTEFGYPELAYQVNKYLLQLIDEYILNSLKGQAKEKRTFIEERITEVSEDLKNSENRLARFKERNLDTDAPKVFLEEQRLLRKVTLNQELYIQLKKQYELARIEEKNDQPLIQILQRPEISILHSRPNRKLIVILSTIVGVFISIFISFFLHLYVVNFKNQQ